MSKIGAACNETGISTTGPMARLLLDIEQNMQNIEQNKQNIVDSLFGVGGLGNVVVSAPQINFSGLRDYHSLTIGAGVTIAPTPGRFTFVRSQTVIFWDGTFLGDAVFGQQGALINFGSQVQSGGGGGGGGGTSGAATGQNGQNGQNGFGGSGPGFAQPAPGVGGAGGAAEVAGGNGTVGVVGSSDPFFANSSLRLYPGILGALTGTVPGAQGASGGNGGDGGDTGAGHGVGGSPGSGGAGGDSGAILILAAPIVILGPNAIFHLQGLPGLPGTVGGPGTAAPGASAGGGGGGGGGGSGGQGGGSGAVLIYYGTFTDQGATYFLAAAAGGAASAGGAGGAGDGAGDAGAAGGSGAAGPFGFDGVTLQTQVFSG